MKKIAIVAVSVFALVLVLFIFAAVYAFKTIKPASETINQNLAQFFSQIIYLPPGVGPSLNFEKTDYFWEMETLENEVVGIKLSHNTAFQKDQNIIYLSLEKEEKGDPSIFNKVLPAVIADPQSLAAAQDPPKANLEKNPKYAYNNIKLAVKPETNQTTKITWEFEKSKLPEDLKTQYQKLDATPPPLLRFLYSLPHFILGLFSGQ